MSSNDPQNDTETKAAKKARKSLNAIRQSLRLWPFIRPYSKWIALMLAVTALFAASEAGRAKLIEPLMNQVLLAKADAGDEVEFKLKLKGGLGDELIEARTAAILLEPRRRPEELLELKDFGLGEPLPRSSLEDPAAQILDRSRRRLEAVGVELLNLGNDRNRIWNYFAQGVKLQREARRLYAAGEVPLAVAISLKARRASHELTFYSAWSTLKIIVGLAIAFAIVLSASQFFSLYLARTLVARVMVDIQNALARHLLEQEVAYFDGQRQGEFFSRLTNDVGTTQIALNVFFSDLLIHPLRLLGLFALAVWTSPMLSLSLVVLGSTVFLPIKYLGKKIRRKARRRQQSAASALGVLQQMLSGIRTVKTFNREEFESERFHARTHELLNLGISVIKSRIAARSWLNLINNLTIPLVFLGGGLLLLKQIGGLDVGSFATFLALVVMMYVPAKQLARAWTQLQDAVSGIDRVFEVFNKEAQIVDRPDAVELGEIKEGIRYEDVCFAYGERRVLHDLNFFAPVGSQTALVGGTGHGKSTTVDLIPRLIVPESGRVTVDGIDICDLKHASLLAQMAVVTQDAFLFHDTIANNIRYGRLDATQEEIEDAARKAQIHDEIVAMSEGYDTLVGERGALLSGGQIQRLTIARALLKNPAILILDEATSGLDTNTERAVQAAFDELKAGRTVFVIAHRLSTIRNADQILVMRDGRIAERGTYDELVAKGGLFSRLARAQALDNVLEADEDDLSPAA